MDSILITSFITGLSAGGLSCFAVQGGLLSGTFAKQAESSHQQSKKTSPQPVLTNKGMALSVLLFLAAKLAAYTLLGLGLGWLGSIFYLSPMLKGILQIGIGIFLVGNALRMFNVHPFFRIFSFEPPSQFTRFIRKISKGNDRLATPLFLGALTILIPCGVTQAAMAVAMGTGNPLMGAAVMFFFITFLPTLLLPEEANIPADPFKTPAHIKPEWYFLAPYQMLKIIPNKFLGISLQLIITAVFILWPFLERKEETNILKRPRLLGFFILSLVLWVVFTVWGKYS